MPATTRALNSSVCAFLIRPWRVTERTIAAKLQGGALFIGLLALLAAGCKNNDLVEAQLRARDNDLRELREELERIEGYNCALQREVGALRTDPTGEKVPPEVAGQTFTLKSIELGRLTGGLNDDNEPGDE